jgi:hypothetical protein
MPKRKGSFAQMCREQFEANGQMTVAELRAAMIQAAPEKVVGRKVQPMVQAVLRDLLKGGEIVRVADRTYRWAARKEPVQLRQKMWSILRSRRVVSVEDLMELTGASQPYAKQWARMLEGHELVRRLVDGRIQLVNDPVLMPEDTNKAEKLRAIRVRKALDSMRQSMEGLAKAVKELEEAVP